MSAVFAESTRLPLDMSVFDILTLVPTILAAVYARTISTKIYERFISYCKLTVSFTARMNVALPKLRIPSHQPCKIKRPISFRPQ